MGNLQRQIAAIRQQLAVSTAETIARLKRNESDMDNLKQAVEQVEQAVEHVQVSQRGVRLAIEDQSKAQQAALDQLLELVAGDQAELREDLDQVKERLSRLEQDRPPAA